MKFKNIFLDYALGYKITRIISAKWVRGFSIRTNIWGTMLCSTKNHISISTYFKTRKSEVEFIWISDTIRLLTIKNEFALEFPRMQNNIRSLNYNNFQSCTIGEYVIRAVPYTLIIILAYTNRYRLFRA